MDRGVNDRCYRLCCRSSATRQQQDDTTGTVSKTEPAVTQDGTPAHPYADASQCPSNTDLIIWPSGRSVPSLPPGISVCFVGDQSFKDGDFGRASAPALARLPRRTTRGTV